MKTLDWIVAVMGLSASLANGDSVAFPSALNGSAVVQSPMAAEIPGSLILGNGDLNGILWIHDGRLRFSITKNDICDGRLDTKDDPESVRIDIKNHQWSSPPRCGNPPSWDKPYPCPLICGHIEFGGQDRVGWSTVRALAKASVRYDAETKRVTATIAGASGDSAGWGFVPKIAGAARKVAVSVSGAANAKWYLDFPGTGVKSGWQPATADATTTEFELPAGNKLERIDFYVWTNDGMPAEIRLHSLLIDQETQSLAGASALVASSLDARLDLARAVGAVTGAAGMKLTARVLANHNAMLFDTTEPVTLTPCTASFIPASRLGKQNGVEWILTKVPGDVDWPGMSFALAHAARRTRHVVAVVSSLAAKDPVAAAVGLAGRLLDEDATKQMAEHEAAWREFWSASGVALQDAYLESVWYRNLYFLRCGSKPGAQPLGLFLGCALDAMPWHGCATTDYNFEQAFWGAFTCNHPELAEPYNRYLVEYLPRGKWFAKETYGLDGAFYPVNHFTHQINDPSVCKSKNQHMNFYLPWTYVPGANGWQAQNVWFAHLYQPDRNYLQRRAYPLVKAMAIFYANFLDQCRKTPAGKAIYGPTYSPEHRDFGVDDTPCDIAWTRFTLRAAIQGATVLGSDADLVKRWQAALTLTPDYPFTVKLQPPVIADARGGEPIQYNVPVPTLPVFPAGEVNWWSSEEERTVFARTIETIETTGYNSVMMLAGARARLSLPDTRAWILREFKKRQMPNGYLQLLGDTRGNYSEQMAAAGIVSELLVQSVGDILRVFPAWPKDQDASFTRLRAQGGLLITAEQKGGRVVNLQITSTVAGKVRWLSPWTNQVLERDAKAGEIIRPTP